MGNILDLIMSRFPGTWRSYLPFGVLHNSLRSHLSDGSLGYHSPVCHPWKLSYTGRILSEINGAYRCYPLLQELHLHFPQTSPTGKKSHGVKNYKTSDIGMYTCAQVAFLRLTVPPALQRKALLIRLSCLVSPLSRYGTRRALEIKPRTHRPRCLTPLSINHRLGSSWAAR